MMKKIYITFFFFLTLITSIYANNYAVLICAGKSDGDDIFCNSEYWYDLFLAYEELIFVEGYSHENIYVIYGDGADWEGTSYPRYRKELHGWTDPIVDYDNHPTTISNVFNILSPIVTANDTLHIRWVVGHGGPGVDPDSYSVLIENRDISISKTRLFSFINQVNNYKKRVIMWMTCHAGCLVAGENTLNDPKTVIITSSKWDESSYSGIHGDTCHASFNYVATSYLYGKDQVGNLFNGDNNEDGKICMQELYTNTHIHPIMSRPIFMGGSTVMKGDINYIAETTFLSEFDDIHIVSTKQMIVDDDNSGSSSGNGNGCLEPNETIEFQLGLKNFGGQDAVNVNGKLSTTNTYVTINNDSCSYGLIKINSIVTNSVPFIFTISPACPEKTTIYFNLEITANGDYCSTNIVSLPVGIYNGPDVQYLSSTIYDSESIYSDNIPDGEVNPGERIYINNVTLTNSGDQTANYVSALLTTTNTNVNILFDYQSFGYILPGETVSNSWGYFIEINSDAPDNHIVNFNLNIQDADLNNWTNGFSITIKHPTEPYITFNSYIVDDDNNGESIGNNDGMVSPDETIELPVILNNKGADATNVTALLSTSSSYITINDNFEQFGNIPSKSQAQSLDDFDFTVDISTPFNTYIPFTLEVSDHKGRNWTNYFSIIIVEPFNPTGAPILLVNRENFPTGYISYYTNALKTNGYQYNVWDTSIYGEVSLSILNQYDVVIWFTGNNWFNTFSTVDQQNVADYLDNGGNLFVTGQDVGFDIWNTSFYNNYLHADYVSDNVGLNQLNGVSSDEISAGITITISGGDGASNQWYPSEIDPISSAQTIFTYDPSSTFTMKKPEYDLKRDTKKLLEISSSGTGALKVDTGTYRLVYFSFGFEAINNNNDRNLVMSRVLDWLIDEDTTPPTIPGIPQDNGVWSGTNVFFHWTKAIDPQSGISNYSLVITTNTNIGGTVFSNNVTPTNYTYHPGEDGKTYWAKVSAMNKAGLESEYSAWSDGVLIDSTSPTIPGIPVDEGDWNTNGNLIFQWTKAIDNQSGISNYSVLVATNTNTGVIFTNNNIIGTNYIYSATNEGKEYFAKAAAVNRAGLQGAYSGWSDGIKVDIDPPILQGVPYFQFTYTTNTNLNVFWQPAIDNGIGVSNYQLRIDGTDGDTNICITASTNTNFIGIHGVTYQACVLSVDKFNHKSSYSDWSDGITVDRTPPDKMFPPMDEGVYSSTNVLFYWIKAVESESEISNYCIVISTNTNIGGTESTNNVGIDTNYIFSPGINEKKYFAKVSAVNKAGLESEYSLWSDGIWVDNTSPATPTNITDEGDLSDKNVLFTWTKSEDFDSGLKGYYIRIAINTNLPSIVLETFVSTNATNYTYIGQHDKIYYAQVCAVDNVGNKSPYSYWTDGILVDSKLPVTTILPDPAKIYLGNVTVEFNVSEANAVTYYTINKEEPQINSGNKYSSPFSINKNITIKYFSVDKVGNKEHVHKAVFEIAKLPDLPARVYNTLVNLSEEGKNKLRFVFRDPDYYSIKICNISGEIVKEWTKEYYTAGYAFEWDGKVNGKFLGSNIYFVKMESDKFKKVFKILVVK